MQPIEKDVAYFEKNQQEFHDLAINYIWNSISDEDELLLSKLIEQSTLLEKKFMQLSEMNSVLQDQNEEYSASKGFINLVTIKIFSAAIFLFSIMIGLFYYNTTSPIIEDVNNDSIRLEMIRSLGNCEILVNQKNHKEIVSRKHSICDIDLEKLRFQRIRIFPNSKVTIHFVKNRWEIEIVQGQAFITTMKNNSTENFYVYLGSNRWIQFLGTSVVVSRDKNFNVKVSEGRIRYLDSMDSLESSNPIIENGSILTLNSKKGYSMSKLNQKESLELEKTFTNIKKDKVAEPKIDIQQILSKKLQEIPGDHVILTNGKEIDVDTIWQDEEFYILNSYMFKYNSKF